MPACRNLRRLSEIIYGANALLAVAHGLSKKPCKWSILVNNAGDS